MSGASYAGEGVQSRWTEAYLRGEAIRALDAAFDARWKLHQENAGDDETPSARCSAAGCTRMAVNATAKFCHPCTETARQKAARAGRKSARNRRGA